MQIKLAMLAALLIPTTSLAQSVVVTTPGSKISQVIRYSSILPEANLRGDTAFGVTFPANPTVCAGGWIPRSDTMYSELVVTIQLAVIGEIPVLVLADSQRIWGGSPTKFCQITGIELRP